MENLIFCWHGGGWGQVSCLFPGIFITISRYSRPHNKYNGPVSQSKTLSGIVTRVMVEVVVVMYIFFLLITRRFSEGISSRLFVISREKRN